MFPEPATTPRQAAVATPDRPAPERLPDPGSAVDARAVGSNTVGSNTVGSNTVGSNTVAPNHPVPLGRGEPILLAALTAAGLLQCTVSRTTAPGWLATGMLGVALLLAVREARPRRGAPVAGPGTAAATLRCMAVLGAAALIAAPDGALSVLSICWVLATAAWYPLVVSRRASQLISSTSALVLCVPVAVRLAGPAPADRVELARLAGHVAAAIVVAGMAARAAVVRADRNETLPHGASLPGGALPGIALPGIALPGGALPGIALPGTAGAPDPARDEAASVQDPDPGTGLPGRAVLVDRIGQALAHSDLLGGPVALLLIELEPSGPDGEGADPELVRQVARRLRAAMPAHDVVARIAPSTFALLAGTLEAPGCAVLARRLSALVAEPLVDAPPRPPAGCWIGAAVERPDSRTPEDLLRAGADALRAARRSGGPRWIVHDPALRAYRLSRHELGGELRRAIQARAIEAEFQPVLNLDPDGSDRIVTVEALARWTRTGPETVSPQRFVPLADELGLGPALGALMLDHATAALAGWQRAGAAIRTVSINVTPAQLEDPGFARAVADQLAERALEPADLTVEVPAETFVDTEQSRNTLAMLRSLGLGVSLDHFGRTGLSLAALGQLPLTEIKLDRSLTASLGADNRLPEAAMAMSGALGLRCVVTGVETQRQLDAARALGAHAAQGFLIGAAARPGRLAVPGL